MNELDEDIPANRILDQWMGELPDRRGQVLMVQYGDGTMTMAWRPYHYATWGPYTEMRQT
jgi:hypothetical protein